MIFFVELFVLPFNRISFDSEFSFCVCILCTVQGAGTSCFCQHRIRSLILFVDTYNWMQQRANSTYQVASSFKVSVCFVLYSECTEKNMWFSESLSFTMQNYQRQCLKCWKQLQRIKFLFSVTAKQQCNCNIHNAKTYSVKLFYGKFICLQFVLFGCVVQFAFKCIHMWASSVFPNICMDVQCFFCIYSKCAYYAVVCWEFHWRKKTDSPSILHIHEFLQQNFKNKSIVHLLMAEIQAAIPIWPGSICFSHIMCDVNCKSFKDINTFLW